MPGDATYTLPLDVGEAVNKIVTKCRAAGIQSPVDMAAHPRLWKSKRLADTTRDERIIMLIMTGRFE